MSDDLPPRVADLVARTLHAHGVRYAFGMPGGEVVSLLDALERCGIGFMLARHETAAAAMAAGTYHATGAPGLLVTTLGPGLANAVNGIADAQQERVPLLVLSGVVERSIRARYTHQIVDQAALLRPLVKASFEIEAEGASATAARALALAMERPYGPVHLDLAPTVAATAATGQAVQVSPARIGRPRPDPADPQLVCVREMLASARRPLVLAGLDAARSAVSQPLQALLERLHAPLLTTYRAKGVVDETHPLVLSGAGLSPLADHHILPLVGTADLVMLVGYDPIEMRPGWLDAFPSTAKVIELTPSPADHAMHAAGFRLVGEVEAVLPALLQGLEGPGDGWENDAMQAGSGLVQAFATPDGRFGPHAVVDALRAVLTPATTVTADSGAHRILLSQKLRLQRPGQLLQSSGWCTMGVALPLAVGMKRARPEQPVIAVMGDGGLEMVAGELATLRDLGLPVTLVVLQDRSLALIALKQAQAGLAPCGVALPPSDLALLAQAFGGVGVTVASRPALDDALAAAASRGQFTLIACQIEAEDYVGRI